MTLPTRARLPGLDLLRAAAISMVVVAHFGVICGWSSNTGSLGVDLFFALSGFLIGGILFDTHERLAQPRVLMGFWLRRWLRTLPNYFLFLGVNILVWLPFYYPHVVRRTVPPYLVFLQNFSHRPAWFFIESWSLSVEEWFYILFPLVLILLLAVTGRFVRTYWTAVGLLMATSLTLRFAMSPPADWGLDVSMIVPYRFDALGWGALAAALSRLQPAFWSRARVVSGLVGLALVVECYLFESRANLTHSYFARTLYPSVSALSLAMLLPWASACPTLGGGWFERGVAATARWSYSLYLVNFMVSILIAMYVLPWAGPSRLALLGVQVFFFAAIFLLSAALYRFVEAPFMGLRKRIPLCREAVAAQQLGATP